MKDKIIKLKRAIGEDVQVIDRGKWIGKLKKVDVLNCECLVEFKNYLPGQDGKMRTGDAALVSMEKVFVKEVDL